MPHTEIKIQRKYSSFKMYSDRKEASASKKNKHFAIILKNWVIFGRLMKFHFGRPI